MPKPTSKKPKITYKQEGGNDGNCYVVRIDGRAIINDCTLTDALYYKAKFLREWEEQQNQKGDSKL